MTSSTKNTIKHYSEKAQHYFDLYNSVDPESVHTDWKAFLHQVEAGFALDVGAGSGRDANWLAEQGWKVTAAEPANELRNLAQANSHNSVTWCNASLPALTALPQAPKTYDLILLSAVWMHLPEAERPAALKRLAELLSENGIIVITLRYGPSGDERVMFEVSSKEVEQIANENGLTLLKNAKKRTEDTFNRESVTWETIVVGSVANEQD